LKLQEFESSPLNHLETIDIIKGDASLTIDQYLEKHPEIIKKYIESTKRR
jgi:hypothetical protein